MHLTKLLLGAACATALTLTACAADDDIVDDLPDTGYLTVNWTINGQTEAELCEQIGALGAEILVYDTLDVFVTEVEVPCSQFVASVELYPDTYLVTVTLVSEDDVPVSDPLDLGLVTVPVDGQGTLVAPFNPPGVGEN